MGCVRGYWELRRAGSLLKPPASPRPRRSSAASTPPALIAFVGGKPLPIGGCGKDPDARFGRGAGATANGYKLRPLPAWECGVPPCATHITSAEGSI